MAAVLNDPRISGLKNYRIRMGRPCGASRRCGEKKESPKSIYSGTDAADSSGVICRRKNHVLNVLRLQLHPPMSMTLTRNIGPLGLKLRSDIGTNTIGKGFEGTDLFS
jgi:hypothetical protein